MNCPNCGAPSNLFKEIPIFPVIIVPLYFPE
jgi:hypothetical protein